jgi:uncharacterized protein
MRIYLDAAPVIYLVEKVEPYYARIRSRLDDPNIVQVVSVLTRLECRVKPLRDGDVELQIAFDAYFAQVVDETISISRAVIDLATDIRAHYGFKTPDSIHLATAVISRCDIFLTHDSRLERFTGITVENLS